MSVGLYLKRPITCEAREREASKKALPVACGLAERIVEGLPGAALGGAGRQLTDLRIHRVDDGFELLQIAHRLLRRTTGAAPSPVAHAEKNPHALAGALAPPSLRGRQRSHGVRERERRRRGHLLCVGEGILQPGDLPTPRPRSGAGVLPRLQGASVTWTSVRASRVRQGTVAPPEDGAVPPCLLSLPAVRLGSALIGTNAHGMGFRHLSFLCRWTPLPPADDPPHQRDAQGLHVVKDASVSRAEERELLLAQNLPLSLANEWLLQLAADPRERVANLDVLVAAPKLGLIALPAIELVAVPDHEEPRSQHRPQRDEDDHCAFRVVGRDVVRLGEGELRLGGDVLKSSSEIEAAALFVILKSPGGRLGGQLTVTQCPGVLDAEERAAVRYPRAQSRIEAHTAANDDVVRARHFHRPGSHPVTGVRDGLSSGTESRHVVRRSIVPAFAGQSDSGGEIHALGCRVSSRVHDRQGGVLHDFSRIERKGQTQACEGRAAKKILRGATGGHGERQGPSEAFVHPPSGGAHQSKVDHPRGSRVCRARAVDDFDRRGNAWGKRHSRIAEVEGSPIGARGNLNVRGGADLVAAATNLEGILTGGHLPQELHAKDVDCAGVKIHPAGPVRRTVRYEDIDAFHRRHCAFQDLQYVVVDLFAESGGHVLDQIRKQIQDEAHHRLVQVADGIDEDHQALASDLDGVAQSDVQGVVHQFDQLVGAGVDVFGALEIEREQPESTGVVGALTGGPVGARVPPTTVGASDRASVGLAVGLGVARCTWIADVNCEAAPNPSKAVTPTTSQSATASGLLSSSSGQMERGLGRKVSRELDLLPSASVADKPTTAPLGWGESPVRSGFGSQPSRKKSKASTPSGSSTSSTDTRIDVARGSDTEAPVPSTRPALLSAKTTRPPVGPSFTRTRVLAVPGRLRPPSANGVTARETKYISPSLREVGRRQERRRAAGLDAPFDTQITCRTVHLLPFKDYERNDRDPVPLEDDGTFGLELRKNAIADHHQADLRCRDDRLLKHLDDRPGLSWYGQRERPRSRGHGTYALVQSTSSLCGRIDREHGTGSGSVERTAGRRRVAREARPGIGHGDRVVVGILARASQRSGGEGGRLYELSLHNPCRERGANHLQRGRRDPGLGEYSIRLAVPEGCVQRDLVDPARAVVARRDLQDWPISDDAWAIHREHGVRAC
eukprot:scaffold959_cov258-Pinguiococcus_pyrenoidosus.AAC.12